MCYCSWITVTRLDRVECYTQGYIHSHTGFRKLTPHHSTGARLVAQSNVNRLISHKMKSIGIGTNSTSVRLRKGRARMNDQSRVRQQKRIDRTYHCNPRT